MSRRRLALTTVLAALALALSLRAGASVASAAEPFEPYRLSDLRVAAGTASWHASNEFQLDWDLPSLPPGSFPIEAIDYLIRDPEGNPVGEVTQVDEAVDAIRNLSIRPRAGESNASPGQYSVEVWARGGYLAGPHASAMLRFDDTRPGPARPLHPESWIRAGTETVLRIEHPPAPLPISGIRGYAVIVDHGSGGAPCAGPDSCTEAETDLDAGIDGDLISLGVLPEGINVARVVAVSGSGMRSRSVESVDLRVDGTEPTVSLTGVPVGWSRGPAQITATASDAQSGMSPSGPAGPFTAIAVDAGAPTIAAGAVVTATVRGDGLHRVRFYGRDGAGNTGGDEAAGGPAGSADIRIDETPPIVSFAAGQDWSEPERIEASVDDSLSGPDSGHGSIAVRGAGSAARFTPIPTKVSAGRLIALWDSDAYPAGSYEFRATGYDTAGNPTSTSRRADGTRMVLSNPLKRPTLIEFGFGGKEMVWHRCKRGAHGVRCRREVIASFERRPSARSIPFGRGVPVAGRLLSSSGAPLPGQPVTLVESFAAGAKAAVRRTVVQTAPDGTFLAHLSPGPSRGVEVSFAGTKQLTQSSGRTIQLAVRAAVRLHASTRTAAIGGAPVVFRGQIAHPEATIPAEGRPVQLQFRVGDTPWSEFRTVQTDAHGRFRYPYSFSDDDSRGVRFQFRAYAPAQPGWPYAPGTSPAVFVTGR
jgi:hypothetical protein